MKNLKNISEHIALLEQTKPVILDFYADWCPPCKVQIPILEKLDASRGEEVDIIKINVDQYQGLAQQYGIRSIPTVVLIKDGEILHKRAGVHTEKELNDLLAGVKEVV